MLFFVFWGSEMSQEERDKEAETVLHLERLRAQGVSLAEIGQHRLWKKGEIKDGCGATEEKAQNDHVVQKISRY